MKTITITFPIMLCTVLFVMAARISSNHVKECAMEEKNEKKVIYLAGGCFWGTEHFLKQIRGVVGTEVGYANGKTENPTYQSVSTEDTYFAETVKVEYLPEQIGLEKLLELFFRTIDPTSLNRQGNDSGDQYRTGIYYTDPEDEPKVKTALGRLASAYSKPIVVECETLKNYYTAEEYHQNYLDKNPGGYCHIPRVLFQMAKTANPAPEQQAYTRPDNAVLKEKLTRLQYEVTRNNATERPFENEYWDEFREGIYVDITTGEPLFVSTDKFESDCGWPSFSRPIKKDLITEKADRSHGMVRLEVRSKTGDAHLGHVFNDGPQDSGGLRYCINSASLRFIAREEMKEEGYGEYLPLLEK